MIFDLSKGSHPPDREEGMSPLTHTVHSIEVVVVPCTPTGPCHYYQPLSLLVCSIWSTSPAPSFNVSSVLYSLLHFMTKHLNVCRRGWASERVPSLPACRHIFETFAEMCVCVSLPQSSSQLITQPEGERERSWEERQINNLITFNLKVLDEGARNVSPIELDSLCLCLPMSPPYPSSSSSSYVMSLTLLNQCQCNLIILIINLASVHTTTTSVCVHNLSVCIDRLNPSAPVYLCVCAPLHWINQSIETCLGHSFIITTETEDTKEKEKKKAKTKMFH